VITSCVHCHQHIRDCTAFRLEYVGALKVSVPVTGWYHTVTGHERCEGMITLATPKPLVSVRCPRHRKPDETCQLCLVESRISLYYHNNHRCIPARCHWPHR
jgi:hypothetical protein